MGLVEAALADDGVVALATATATAGAFSARAPMVASNVAMHIANTTKDRQPRNTRPRNRTVLEDAFRFRRSITWSPPLQDAPMGD